MVNDGSTDNTRYIAEQFPVRLINQSNKGLAMARNSGIMNAQGEYMLPLDSDDWISPTYLAKTVPLLDANPKVAAIYPAMEFVGEVEHGNVHVPPKKFSLEDLLRENHLIVCSLIRKEALLECGGYNTRLYAFEDWNLWVDIMKRGWEFILIPEALFKYRRRRGTMIETEGWTKEADLSRIMREAHPDLAHLNPFSKRVI